MAAIGRKRKLTKPRKLLPELLNLPSGIWVDAASGDGVFGQALLEIANPSIDIIGFDIDRSVVQHFISQLKARTLQCYALQADLRRQLPFVGVDGIILANGLHFYPRPQQVRLLEHCAQALRQTGQLVVVEYNTERSTNAVPYPISEKNINHLLSPAGFTGPKKISRVRSTYLGEMYAVLTEKISM
jgi:SAM-dependent methyltransferase